jgi:outer membrane protein insertion porin family
LTIEALEFRGAKRIPQIVLRALMVSRAGGPFDIETLRRDAQALRNTQRFSDIVWEAEPGRAGAIVRFVVAERPLIRSVEYEGDDTVTVAEILERFKQRKVKLGVETLYIEDELGRAAATVQELLAEKGRRNIAVTPRVEPVWPESTFQNWPPSTVKIAFRAEEKR